MYTVWSGSAHDPISIRPEWPLHEVRGLFSFRQGGVSEEPYASLNVGFHVGDQPHHVLENRVRCAHEIDCPVDNWVVAEQVHGALVAKVTKAQAGRGARESQTSIQGADALITDHPGVGLVVMAADCVPILFYDRTRRAIGAAHSGWKGTVLHIAQNVVTTMQAEYGTNPNDLSVWIGPSIRQCCYEVNDVVAEPVQREFGSRYVLKRFGRPGKYLMSLQACVRSDLLQAGVPPENIVDTGVCTACQADVVFSHRADHGRTGRHLGLISLVE